MKRTTEVIDDATLGRLTLARGRVAGRDDAGRLLVRLEPRGRAEVACDLLMSGAEERDRLRESEEVLVALDPAGPPRGIVLGRVGTPHVIAPAAGTGHAVGAVMPGAEPPEEAELSASRRVVVRAGQELILECGEGSIRITRDGKIMIRGENILSRARGTHRIKGGSVAIN